MSTQSISATKQIFTHSAVSAKDNYCSSTPKRTPNFPHELKISIFLASFFFHCATALLCLKKRKISYFPANVDRLIHEALKFTLPLSCYRTELLECYSDQDFLAKLHCVRQAFQVCFSSVPPLVFYNAPALYRCFLHACRQNPPQVSFLEPHPL